MSRASELRRVLFGTIKEIVEDEEGYLGLVVELPTLPYIRHVDKLVVWFYRDDEGNGPGSFHIQELPNER